MDWCCGSIRSFVAGLQLLIGFWQNVESHLCLLAKLHWLAEGEDCFILVFPFLTCLYLWPLLVENKLMDCTHCWEQQRKGFPQQYSVCLCQAVVSPWQSPYFQLHQWDSQMSWLSGSWSSTCWPTLSISFTYSTHNKLPLQSLRLETAEEAS